MKKIFGKISSRLLIYTIFIAVQCILLSVFALSVSLCSDGFHDFLHILGFAVTLRVIFSEANPTFKIVWAVILLVCPSFGIILYLIAVSKKSYIKNYNTYSYENIDCNNEKTAEKLLNESPQAYTIYKYINNVCGSCVYENTQTKLFPCGELFFKDYISELSKAEKFIFIEYFIISEGELWNRVLNILTEKSKCGVEVRIIYDGLGTVNFFKKNYFDKLSEYGIKSAAFNPFFPVVDTLFKCRDHRKITVIDNKISYTGGLNLADEYINLKHPYGYWKDYAIKISGNASAEFTLMFLNSWNFCNKSYLENLILPQYSDLYENDGFVIPFGDVPYNKNPVGKLVYMGIIQNACNYIYITTPYLILDDEMISLLRFKAMSGVDVRIITPHIPDKKYVHAVTRSNYHELTDGGVRIFEYTNGFIHAKSVISDDNLGITGTVNFDFRSFHMLFENSVFMYKSNALSQIKNDCIKMIDESIEITDDFFKNQSFIKRIIYAVLKFFSPLM